MEAATARRSVRCGAAGCGSVVRVSAAHAEPPIPPSAATASASATTAAVSVRRTVGPSDATTAPRATSASTSSALSPPSGPTTSAMRAPSRSPKPGERLGDAGAAMLLPEHDRAVVARKQLERARRTPAGRGRAERPTRFACSAADLAMRRQRSPRLVRFASSSLTTEREVVTPDDLLGTDLDGLAHDGVHLVALGHALEERHARKATTRRGDRTQRRGDDAGVARRDHLEFEDSTARLDDLDRARRRRTRSTRTAWCTSAAESGSGWPGSAGSGPVRKKRCAIGPTRRASP